MTISSTTSRQDYTGNDSTETYNYGFKIFNEDDILVTVVDTSDGSETTLTKTTDYTVTGVGSSSGGTVVLVDASQAWISASSYLDTGYKLVLRRQLDLLQSTSLDNQGPFYAQVHEDQFDRQVMTDQQQQDEIDRSLKLSEGIDPADFDATIPGSIVGKENVTFMTNAAGDAIVEGPTASDLVVATSSVVAAAEAAQTAAELAQTGAETAETNAETAQTAAEAAQALAETAQTAAETAQSGAETAETNAAASASDASDSAAAAAASASGEAVETLSTTSTIDSGTTLAIADTDGITLTLPAIGTTGKSIKIINTVSGISTITIDGNGAETINGSTTTTLNTQYESVTLIDDGSEWLVLRRDIPSQVISFTPTAGVGYGTISSLEAAGERYGARFRGTITFIAGTVTATSSNIDFPSELTMSADVSNTYAETVGFAYRAAASTLNEYHCYYVPSATTTFHISPMQNGSYTPVSSTNAGNILANGQRLTINFDIKVDGWNG